MYQSLQDHMHTWGSKCKTRVLMDIWYCKEEDDITTAKCASYGFFSLNGIRRATLIFRNEAEHTYISIISR